MLKKSFFYALLAALGMTSIVVADGNSYNNSTSRENKSRFAFKGDFIYWQAKEEGLEYVNITNILSDGSQVFQERKPRFNWDPGFKVGIVYSPPCASWRAVLDWTHYTSNAKDSFAFASTDGSGIDVQFPCVDLVLITNTVGSLSDFSASASWKLRYDVANFTVRREQCLCAGINLIEFIGLRGVKINQNFNRSYIIPDTADNEFRAKNDFSGLGLVAGFDTSFKLARYFGIYANVEGSVLYGKFNIKKHGDFFVTDSAGNTTLTTQVYRQNYSRFRSSLDMGIGIEYNYNFACSNKNLRVRLGYEWLYWYNQNELYQSPVLLLQSEMELLTRQRDLMLSGAILSAKFAF